MSVTGLVFEEKSLDWLGDIQPGGTRFLQASWCVITDTAFDGPVTVLEYALSREEFPNYGEIYGGSGWAADSDPTNWTANLWEPGNDHSPPFGANVAALEFLPRRIGSSGTNWRILVKFYEIQPYVVAVLTGARGLYGGLSTATILYHEQPNPLLRPTRLNTHSRYITEVMEKDAAGVPVVNSANQPFNPPLTFDVPMPVFEFTRFEWPAPYDLKLIAEGALNSTPFTIGSLTVPKDKARLARVLIGNVQRNRGQNHVEVKYSIETDARNYLRKPLDQGMKHLDADGNLVQAVDKHGQPVNEPVLLDGAGKRLAVNGTPVYLSFREPTVSVQAFDFNQLQLHNTIVT